MIYLNDYLRSFSMLGEFLLSDIYYDDEDAVKLAYDIYASILNKDYDFIRLIPDKKIDEGLIKDKMHDNEYEIEDISINKTASEGTEKSEREAACKLDKTSKYKNQASSKWTSH